jgi:hypothetical protein
MARKLLAHQRLAPRHRIQLVEAACGEAKLKKVLVEESLVQCPLLALSASSSITAFFLPGLRLIGRHLRPLRRDHRRFRLSAHRALTDAQNAGDAFLASPALAQGINLTAILVRYSLVFADRQSLAMSRGYPLSRHSIMRWIVESAREKL